MTPELLCKQKSQRTLPNPTYLNLKEFPSTFAVIRCDYGSMDVHVAMILEETDHGKLTSWKYQAATARMTSTSTHHDTAISPQPRHPKQPFRQLLPYMDKDRTLAKFYHDLQIQMCTIMCFCSCYFIVWTVSIKFHPCGFNISASPSFLVVGGWAEDTVISTKRNVQVC